jgi:hypothetical protein
LVKSDFALTWSNLTLPLDLVKSDFAPWPLLLRVSFLSFIPCSFFFFFFLLLFSFLSSSTSLFGSLFPSHLFYLALNFFSSSLAAFLFFLCFFHLSREVKPGTAQRAAAVGWQRAWQRELRIEQRAGAVQRRR